MSAYCWTVNSLGEVWTLYPEGGGQLMSPAGQEFAFDIDVDTGGIAWIVSTQARPGGAVIMGREPENTYWLPIAAPAAATRLSTAPDGTLWAVNDTGEVWIVNMDGSGKLMSPQGQDFALDVSVSAGDGSVWIISTDINDTGNALKRWDSGSNSWITLPAPASADKVSVAPNGNVWTVNTKGEVWMLYPQGGGELVSPAGQDFAQDIGVGPDGTVWIVGNEARPGGDAVMWYSGSGTSWNTIPAPAAATAVAGAVIS